MPIPMLSRPLWRGRTNVDLMTITAIERAEKRAGFEFEVTQGSYQGGGGDSKSAGTHDGGGTVDLRTKDLTLDQKRRMVRALRLEGFAAWLRTPAQGFTEHVHAVLGGHPTLAASAERQWVAYVAGRNGLANNGPDDGPRIIPIPTFTFSPPPEEDDMPTPKEFWTHKIGANEVEAWLVLQRAQDNAHAANQLARQAVAALAEMANLMRQVPNASVELQQLAEGIVAKIENALENITVELNVKES